MTEDTAAVEAVARRLRDHLAALGAATVAPPVLQPAGVYLELVGEDIRRRAVLTQSEDFCLRPDMTIPAARLALQLEGWSKPEGFALLYDGRVFRRQGEAAAPLEPRHVGVEWYAPQAQSPACDRLALLSAVRACAQAGVRAQVVLGCLELLRLLTAACGLPGPEARRVRRAGLSALRADAREPSALGAALAHLPPAQVEGVLRELLEAAGLVVVGGRSLADIAARLRRRALAGSQPPLAPERLALLQEALDVCGEPLAALGQLRAIAARLGEGGPAILARLEALERFWSGLLAEEPALAGARFDAGFQRDFEYYDGVAFDLLGASGALLGGGGRYDAVLPALASSEQAEQAAGWGAVGFSLAPAALALEGG